MKKLFTGLVFALLATFVVDASATSKDNTRRIAEANGYYAGLTKVTLLEDGRLYVENDKGKTKVVRLNKFALTKIKNEIQNVANLDISVVKRQVVCMMVAPVLQTTLTNLLLSKFDETEEGGQGEMRHVLTSSGCWMPTEIRFADDWAREASVSIREQLVIAALALIK